MIIMYLPEHIKCKFECEFIPKNMEAEIENSRKCNYKDKQLIKNLKKHNWLMKKIKEQCDVSVHIVHKKNMKSEKKQTNKKKSRSRKRIWYLPSNEDIYAGPFKAKYNSRDERLSRDLKKHNWLLNKLKHHEDVSENLVTEENLLTPTAKEETIKSKDAENNMDSIPKSPDRCTIMQPSVSESVNNIKKETVKQPSCEIVDFSMKKRAIPELIKIDSLNYHTLNNHRLTDKVTQTVDSSSEENIDLISNDKVLDLSLNSQKQTDLSFIVLSNDNCIGSEEPIDYTNYFKRSHENKLESDTTRSSEENAFSLRSDDSESREDSDKREPHIIYLKAQAKTLPRTVCNRKVEQIAEKLETIKHNLPLATLPQNKKLEVIPPITLESDVYINNTFPRKEICSMTKKDVELLDCTDCQNINQTRYTIDNTMQNNDNQINIVDLISDSDSDNENEDVNILRKLLEDSKQKKEFTRHMDNSYSKIPHVTKNMNADTSGPQLNEDKINEKHLKKIISILVTKYDQELNKDDVLVAPEREKWDQRRKKNYHSFENWKTNNLTSYSDQHTHNGNLRPPKHRSAFKPLTPELHRQRHSLYRPYQSLPDYLAQNYINLPRRLRLVPDVEAEKQRDHVSYRPRTIYQPQIMSGLHSTVPAYSKQRVGYIDMCPGPANIRYSPVRHCDQLRNIEAEESYYQQPLPTWCNDRTAQSNYARSYQLTQSANRSEVLTPENLFRDIHRQRMPWDSQIPAYRNDNWTE